MSFPHSVQRALEAKGNRKPDYQRLKSALKHQEPDLVPLFEMGIEPEIKQLFMGHSVQGHAQEIEFFETAGFDAYPVSLSVINANTKSNANLKPVETDNEQIEKSPDGVQVTSYSITTYKAELEAYTERHWAEMHKGVITNKDEFVAYPWPNPDDLDFSILDQVGAMLPPGMKIGVVIGKVFTGVWFMMGM